MAICYLCRIPEIDNTYSNVLDFNSESSLKNFILSRSIYNLGDYNIKYDGNIPVIDVQKSYDNLLQIDYLYMIKDNIYTCYFVIKKEMHASDITRLTLELDVWMTNMFKIEFMTSLIDRCHVHRWTQEGYPTKEIVSEPVALGTEVISGTPEAMCKTNEGVYIYITRSPIGMIKKDVSSGGDIPEPKPEPPTPTPGDGTGDPSQGIPSINGFVFIKAWEGLAQYSHNIGDGVQTIGYGCTDEFDPTHYAQLKPLEPVPEYEASNVLADSLINNYGIQLRDKLIADGIFGNITPNMFDALLSFTFNAGYGALIRSDMYASIVAGNYEQAYTYWLTTSIGSSGFNEGLRARRQAEADVFLKGEYAPRTITIFGQGGSSTGTVTDNLGKGYIPEVIGNTGSDLNLFTDARGNTWYLPLDKGWTSALYGSYPGGGAHYGIDFTWQTTGAIRGANIYAPKAGLKVTKVVSGYDGDTPNNSAGFGNYVTLYDESRDCYLIFGHMLSTPYVKVNDIVDYNTVLGQVGTSGNSTGYHLHWEIRYGANSSSSSVSPIANSTLNTWYYRKGSGN